MRQQFKVCSNCGQNTIPSMSTCGRCGQPFPTGDPIVHTQVTFNIPAHRETAFDRYINKRPVLYAALIFITLFAALAFIRFMDKQDIKEEERIERFRQDLEKMKPGN